MERRNRGSRGSLVVASIVVMGLLGCGGTPDQAAMTADLERDLDLVMQASPPRTMVVSVLEGGPSGAPSGTARGRRDAVVTPRRAPRPVAEAPREETSVAELPEAAPAAADPGEPTPASATEAEQPVAEPELAAVPGGAGQGTTAGTGDVDGHGEAGRGQGRRGSGWGTLIGVIIRGGAAGVDNCEAHDRRRAGRRRPGGYGGEIIAVGGGMGGAIGGVIANGGIRPTFPRY